MTSREPLERDKASSEICESFHKGQISDQVLQRDIAELKKASALHSATPPTQPESRKSLVERIIKATGSNEETNQLDPHSIKVLHEEATNTHLPDHSFISHVLNRCAQRDRIDLGISLGQSLYPREFERAKELAKHAPKECRESARVDMLISQIVNPERKEPADLYSQHLALLELRTTPLENKLSFLDWAVESVASKSAKAEVSLDIARTSEQDDKQLSSYQRFLILKEGLNSQLSDADFIREVRRTDSREQTLELLFEKLFPEKNEQIAHWTQFSSKRNQARHQHELRMGVLEGPDEPEIDELLVWLPCQNGRDAEASDYKFINDLYASVLKGQVDNPKASLAIYLTNLSQTIKSPSSVNWLYLSALDPDTTYLDFKTESFEETSDTIAMRRAVLAKDSPKKLEVVDSLLQFASDDKRERLATDLLRAALRSGEQETALEIVERAIGPMVIPHLWREGRTDLYRLAAKSQAQTDWRAQALVRICESTDSKNGPRVTDLDSRKALYEAALHPSLDKTELFEKISSGLNDVDRPFVQKSLAREFFPQLNRRVKQLTAFSKPKAEPRHWMALFETAIQHPNEENLSRLVELATSEIPSTPEELQFQNSLRILALKHEGLEISDEVAAALETGELPFSEFESIYKSLQTKAEPQGPDTQLENDLILIDGEILKVDL